MKRKQIIIDLEATCDDGDSFPRDDMEIIEIGAILYDVDGTELDRFHSMVKPIVHETLTDFCITLTSITQSDVDGARTFDEVFPEFDSWVGKMITEHSVTEWSSWGAYDLYQFYRDIKRHSLPSINFMSLNHNNLSEEFRIKQGLKRRRGVMKAIDLMGLNFTGVHHRAISDVENIAKIVYS